MVLVASQAAPARTAEQELTALPELTVHLVFQASTANPALGGHQALPV